MPKNKKALGRLLAVASPNDLEILKNSPYYFIFPRAIKAALRGYHTENFSTIIAAYFAICRAPDWFWWLIRQHDALKTSLRLHCCKIIYQKGYFNYDGVFTDEQIRCFRLICAHPNLADMKTVLDTLQTLPLLTSTNYPLALLLVLLQHSDPIKLANASLTILSYQHVPPVVTAIFLKGLPQVKNRRSVMALFESEDLQAIFPECYFEQSVMALCRSSHPEYFVGVISMVSPMLFKQPLGNYGNTYCKLIEHSEPMYLYFLVERMIENDWLNADDVLIHLDMLLNARVPLEELFKSYHLLDKIGLISLPNLISASRCSDLAKVRESMSLLHPFKLNQDSLQYFFDKMISENFLTKNRQCFLFNLKKVQGKSWPEVAEHRVMFERILNYVDSEEEAKQDIEDAIQDIGKNRVSPIPEPAMFFFGIK